MNKKIPRILLALIMTLRLWNLTALQNC